MKENEHERRDWIIVFAILLFGLLCVFLASGLALRFSPSWKLNANMGSDLDPNSDYLTRPSGFVEAIEAAIQTQPVWMGFFLTEGAMVPTRVRMTNTPAPFPTSTRVVPTTTKNPTGTPTNTLVYLPFTRTATLNPAFTRTSTATPKATSTAAATGTATRTPTATGTATHTAVPTNTATATNSPTATSTSTNTPTATATATTVPPLADLQITITDNATDYDANASVRYMITASNPSGPSNAIGAAIISSFSSNLTNITWTCMSGGSGNGNINATVNIPKGSSITCTVDATAISSPNGSLISSATINPPAGITDSNSGNNSATDTDTLIIPDVTPPEIGTGPDNNIYVVPSDSVLTLQLSSPVTVNGHAGWDLVYYEWPQASATTTAGIWMDCVILQVGDGKNWYTILNWGDNKVDTNASMNMKTIGVSAETDNIPVDASLMYNNTGIAIELDNVIPSGTYKYFRIISPATPLDDGDGAEVDGIAILP